MTGDPAAPADQEEADASLQSTSGEKNLSFQLPSGASWQNSDAILLPPSQKIELAKLAHDERRLQLEERKMALEEAKEKRLAAEQTAREQAARNQAAHSHATTQVLTGMLTLISSLQKQN